MSLRFRLNLFITLLFLMVLVSGSIYVIHNARQAVMDEVRATAYLTLQLINIALSDTAGSSDSERQNHVLEQIADLESTRHLSIELFRTRDSYRREQRVAAQAPEETPINASAPGWFVELVKPSAMEFRQVVDTPGDTFTEILIRANPSDEITEVWRETRGVLTLMLVFVLLANLLVFITIGWGLAPLENILKGLEEIEHGDYRFRLAAFDLPELSRLSEKFNLMAERLHRSREENRYLTQRSLAIQEDERRRLAHELHDELGQSITAIKAVAVSIEKQSSTEPEAIRDSAETIIEVSNRMYDVARNMMRRLRPLSMDEFGLITALQDMIDDWNSRHQDTFCYFSFEGEMTGLDEEININLYRIVQESLTNVVKHADASTVKINITIVADMLDGKNSQSRHVILIIEDNGRGFDKLQPRHGLGLLGMRERVESLGGTFTLNSRPGHGVKIEIRVPLQAEQNQ